MEFLLLNSVYSIIVLFVVLLIRILLHRKPKVFSYMLWGIFFLRLLCPVSFSSEISIIPDCSRLFFADGEYEAIAADDAHVSHYESAMMPQENEAIYSVENNAAAQLSDYSADETVGIFRFSADSAAFFVWLSGMFIALLLYGASWFRLKKKVSTATLVEENIFASDRISTAFAYGLIKPRIYVPCWVEDERYRCMVCHERIHVRRGDHIAKHLAIMTAIIYWFNPAVWLSLYLMCRDMEQACDESVIDSMGDRVKSSYSRMLLDFSVSKPLLTGTAFGESSAKKRITNVLKYKKACVMEKAAALAAVLLAAVICIGCNAPTESELAVQNETAGAAVSSADVQDSEQDIYETYGSAADPSVLAELGEAQIVLTTQLEMGSRMNIAWSGNSALYIDWGDGKIVRFVSADVIAGDTVKLYSTGDITILYCSGNRLTEVDVGNCPALTVLDCSNNELSKLDVSGNLQLQTLTCDNNQLSRLDISANTQLRTLVCSGNRLRELDISQNTELRKLSCGSNRLTALNISRNPKLSELHCSGNQIEKLDTSGNPELTVIND